MAIQTRAAATRQRLIDAAVRQFTDNGYLLTTPQDIAVAADLTTGAFYYHFKSKEDLAEAIISQVRPMMTAVVGGYITAPGCGAQSVVHATFAAFEIFNRQDLYSIGFHLSISSAHRGPAARQDYRNDMAVFSTLMGDAFADGEIRDGLTRPEIVELLWVTITGSKLMSNALEETGPAVFTRLGTTLKMALRTIVPDEVLPRLEAVVDATAAHYAGERTPVLSQSA